MDELIKQIELTKIKVQPDEVLAITLKLEDGPTQAFITTLKDKLSRSLQAKVIVFAVSPNESVEFTTISKEQADEQLASPGT